MNPIVVTKDLAAIGMKVVRGPAWEWDEQDGGRGSIGIIIDEPDEDGWVAVTWEKGGTRSYRVGGEKMYDLCMYDPFTSTGMNLTNPKPQIQKVRQALSQSIKKADSFIEKSNTKHGNSNTRVSITSTGAIKVRRSSSKIKRSEGRGS